MKKSEKIEASTSGGNPVISVAILILAIIVFYALCSLTVMLVTLIANSIFGGGIH